MTTTTTPGRMKMTVNYDGNDDILDDKRDDANAGSGVDTAHDNDDRETTVTTTTTMTTGAGDWFVLTD